MNASTCPRCRDPLTGAGDGYCARCAGRLLLEADADEPALGELRGLRVGPYELREELGRGAMGVVYRAHQPRLRREVALKVILASRFVGEAARKRFLAEAELAAQLDHPNIVPIYEVGETPDGPFYAMKLVEGGTLASQLLAADPANTDQPHSPNSAFRIARLMARVGRAVHHAHQRGVLHRDLKPGNILLDADGEPHITDFGLARQIGAESSLTATGSSIGTPAYMSPEQARGEKASTVAADVWSLGAILYHLLTGRPPFEGATAMEVMHKVMESEPAAPGFNKTIRHRRSTFTTPPEANADTRDSAPNHSRDTNDAGSIDRDLGTICLRCLEKDPARRYASALALAEDLERWLNHEPILARPSTTVERMIKWARRHPGVAALLAVATLLLIVGTAGIFSQWRRAEQNAAAERASNEQGREQLRRSLLAQASAGRLSGQFGRKRAGLEAIAAAAAIRPSAELRDEAIAHLALFDLRPGAELRPLASELWDYSFDANLERYVMVDKFTSVVSLRQISDDAELFRWPAPVGLANPQLSPQGHHVFFTRDSDVFVFDAQTGAERLHLDDCYRAGISPDEQTVAVMSRGSRIRFHHLSSGEKYPREVEVKNIQDNYLYWSPDSQFLTVTAHDKMEIWNWRRGERVEQINHDWALSGAVAWAGECLAFGDFRGGIQLWNIRTRASRMLPSHDAMIYEVVMDGTGSLLASFAPDGTTRFWNTATGQLLLTTERGQAVAFSRDGRRVAYRTASGLGFWSVDGSRAYRLVSTRDRNNNTSSAADFSPDSQTVLSAAVSSGLHSVDLVSGHVLKLDASGLRAAWFMPDAKTVLTSGDNQPAMFRPILLSTNSAGERHLRLGRGRAVPGLEGSHSDTASVSDDGRWLGTSLDRGDIVVVDLTGSNAVRRLRSPHPANRPTFGAEGRWIVVSSPDHGPLLFDGHSGKLAREFHPHPGHGRAQFSPDGRRLVTADPTGVRFYETTQWTVVRHWPDDAGSNLGGGVAFTPDSRIVAVTTGKRGLHLADARTGERLATLISPEPRAINSLRFSRDGRQLAVATTTDAFDLWNLEEIESELQKLNLPLGANFSEPRTEPASPLTSEAMTFPPRAPAATRHQIDLSRHFNASLTENWIDHAREDSSLRDVPRGLQTLDGVTWDIRAIVQLSGTGLRRTHPWFPKEEQGIVIGQICRRLHFLLAHVGDEKKRGVEAGSCVFQYADGGRERVRLRIGEELGDFWHDPKNPVQVRQANVAWTGQNERARVFGCTLQLFHWTWENPRREVAVASIDFVSAMNAPAPFLVAITAED